MLQLPQVTLIAVATKHVEAAVEALRYSTRGIRFGAVKLVSHYEPDFTYGFIDHEQIPGPFPSIDDWCNYVFYNLGHHVQTEFACLIHEDGFIVNPGSWRDEFLDYDYIGAPWPVVPPFYTDPVSNEVVRVGNSVSIRSKALLDYPIEAQIPWESFEGGYHEDTIICVKNRTRLLQEGFKFAPIEVAKYFSHETLVPEIEGITPFAFHKHHHEGHPNWKYPKFD